MNESPRFFDFSPSLLTASYKPFKISAWFLTESRRIAGTQGGTELIFVTIGPTAGSNPMTKTPFTQSGPFKPSSNRPKIPVSEAVTPPKDANREVSEPSRMESSFAQLEPLSREFSNLADQITTFCRFAEGRLNELGANVSVFVEADPGQSIRGLSWGRSSRGWSLLVAHWGEEAEDEEISLLSEVSLDLKAEAVPLIGKLIDRLVAELSSRVASMAKCKDFIAGADLKGGSENGNPPF